MAKQHTLTFEHIPPFPEERDRDEPFAAHVIVETPAWTRHKFALNHEYGVIAATATLRPQLRWPCDFGFVPQTKEDDGDPIDVALLIDEPTFPSCLVFARIIGTIGMVKDDVHNDRLVAVMLPQKSSLVSTDKVRELSDLPEGLVAGLETFLRTYPHDGTAKVELTGRRSAAEAHEHIRASHKRWKKGQ